MAKLHYKYNGTTKDITLSTTKSTSPALAVKYSGTTYYAGLSARTPSSGDLCVKSGGTTYVVSESSGAHISILISIFGNQATITLLQPAGFYPENADPDIYSDTQVCLVLGTDSSLATVSGTTPDAVVVSIPIADNCEFGTTLTSDSQKDLLVTCRQNITKVWFWVPGMYCNKLDISTLKNGSIKYGNSSQYPNEYNFEFPTGNWTSPRPWDGINAYMKINFTSSTNSAMATWMFRDQDNNTLSVSYTASSSSSAYRVLDYEFYHWSTSLLDSKIELYMKGSLNSGPATTTKTFRCSLSGYCASDPNLVYGGTQQVSFVPSSASFNEVPYWLAQLGTGNFDTVFDSGTVETYDSDYGTIMSFTAWW